MIWLVVFALVVVFLDWADRALDRFVAEWFDFSS